MNIHKRDYNNILKNFPDIELSYEKNLYNKVHHSDIYITIPKGRKFFAWFCKYKNNNVCLILQLNKKKTYIEHIKIIHSCFDKYLCSGKGTILYGTIFFVNNLSFFNIENIFYFKGINIQYYNQLNKLNTIVILLNKHIKQIIFSKHNITFGLPLMDTNYNNLIDKIKTISYSIYFIQHRSLYKNKPFLNEKINIKKELFANFLIKPSIQCDIYDLYYYDNNELLFYDNAFIPDYKTSVYMNSLFRKIKENDNLDTLEESDDEEEFENISEDKFVYLDKFYTIKCVYLFNFKQWKPISITHEPIVKKCNLVN